VVNEFWQEHYEQTKDRKPSTLSRRKRQVKKEKKSPSGAKGRPFTGNISQAMDSNDKYDVELNVITNYQLKKKL